MEKLMQIKQKLAEFWEKRSVLILVVSSSLFVTVLSAYLLLNNRKGGKGTFPANTNIVAVKGAYAYENTTNGFESHFKSKATEPESIAFSNTVGKITFYTPNKQSFGELNSEVFPVVSGSTLTYPDIFTQTNLSYTISSSRLLEEFIVKDAATANKIDRIEQRAKTDATYEESKDGSITFTENDKTAFTLPHPVMYEVDSPANKSTGITYEIKKDGGELIVSKVITAQGKAWLSDKNRKYPVAIDLVIDNADTSSD